MKKFTKALCVILASVMMLSSATLFIGADTPGIKFTHPVDVSFMKYGSPVIDGNITENEGWSNMVDITEENLVAVTTNCSEYFPTATFSLAWDDDNMYLCADIKDDDFYYSTGVCEEVIYDEPDGTTDIPDNNCGWDGDVFAFEVDPLGIYVEEGGRILGSDMVTWICFGLFEDGHVGAYLTNIGEEDVTDAVETAGARTDDGWRFEAAMPWAIIEKMFDNSLYGKLKFDKSAFTADLAESTGCIFLCDRRYDVELGEVEYNNIFATASVNALAGPPSVSYPYPCVSIEGLSIVAVGKNGDSSAYIPVTEPTTLKWENKFNDIAEGEWYYNAVAKACDKGWFAGLSETTFAPANTLTRAMFVTTLARVARARLGEAEGTMFKDVPAGKWYSAPVEWAASTGITGGTGEGCFSPDAPVTRQQIAQFLYKLAVYKQYRTDGVDENALESFPDKADTASWAVDAVTWAVSNGLISGVKEGDKTLLYPAANTTRSQCAQMLSAFDAKEFSHLAKDDEYAKVTICGNDISEYVIVYGNGSDDKTAADELAKYIALTANVTLDVVNTVEDGAKAIHVATDESMIPETYTVETRDGDLFITAGQKKGILYGVYGFLQDHMGWIFAFDKSEERLYNMNIELPDGMSDTQSSILDYSVWFSYHSTQDDMWKYKIRRSGDRASADDGTQCSIPWMLNNGDWSTHMDKNPCYSDPELIDRITELTLARMAKNPSKKVYSFGMNDSSYYCMCDRCVAIYREEGSRTGTFVRLCHHVMDRVKELYPENKMICFGYNFSTEATKTPLPDNMIIRYITITACINHPLDEPNCPVNKFLYNNLIKWNENSQQIWTADDIGYNNSVFNLDYFYNNISLYNSLGSTGYINWCLGGWDIDHGYEVDPGIENMVIYLMNRHFWDTDMTHDRYYILAEEYLETYCGAGWKNVLDYIDILAKMQSFRHYGWHAHLEDSFSYTLYKDTREHLKALYAAAMEKAGDEKHQKNVDVMFRPYNKLGDLYPD